LIATIRLVRGSRARGVTCRVSLRIGNEQFAGEAEEGLQSDRSRVDVAARAALVALGAAPSLAGMFSLEGVRMINAFDREFVFAAVMARQGREQVMLTGSCSLEVLQGRPYDTCREACLDLDFSAFEKSKEPLGMLFFLAGCFLKDVSHLHIPFFPGLAGKIRVTISRL